MSSAVDIQIVSTPNLEKIENFFKDSTYRESIEFSANFNTRLCIERRLRLPFFDPQTGVAQNHSNLFINKRHRMPGFKQGQIYTYPAQRWRKSRRQYLNKMYKFPDRPFQALRKDHDALLASTASAGTSSPIVGTSALGLVDPDFNGSLLEESSSLGAAGGDTSDSKDSQQQLQQSQQQHQQQQQVQHKDDLSKDWYYDEMDINDVDSLEEPKSPADDEYDYDPRYGSKKRRKRRPGKRATMTPGEGSGAGRRRSGAGRGRTSAVAAAAAAAATASIGDISLTGSDTIDGSGGGGGVVGSGGGISSAGGTVGTPLEASTPTTSGSRRSRGSGTRGRRRTKAAPVCDPPSPGLNSEPPTFEMAAAAVGVVSDLPGATEEHADLRNYRKYL